MEAEELIKVSTEKKQKRQHGQEEKIFTLGESMSIVPIKLSSRDSEALALVAIKAAAMILVCMLVLLVDMCGGRCFSVYPLRRHSIFPPSV